ncbi:MAG: hypothetical protein AB8B53_00430 [Flavobacteriales bacterium]
MNLKLITAVLLIGVFLVSCKTKESLAEAPDTSESTSDLNNPYLDNSTQFISVELTQRTTFAGVQSNLAGNRNYRLSFEITEMNSPIEFKRLMVDSISIPFSTMNVDGDKKLTFAVSETKEKVTLSAYRNVYSRDPSAPQMVEEVEYEKSGLSLKGTAVAEYIMSGKPYYLEIPELKKLENIYAP